MNFTKELLPLDSAALCGCFCHRFNRIGCKNRQLYFLIDKRLLFTATNLPMTIIILPTAAVTDEASGHRDFLLESPSNTTAAADTHMNVSAVVH